jgi:hypothetical protein
MADMVATKFDYGDLDQAAVSDLERRAAAIAEEQVQVRRRAADGVIRVGRDLAAAHDLLAGKGRDGLFRPWVQERCHFSYRTAYNAIQASETFGTKKCETVSHFFDTAAMYLLSGDSCPLKATEAAICLAKNGQHITRQVAEELRRQYTEESETCQQAQQAQATTDQAAEVQEPVEAHVQNRRTEAAEHHHAAAREARAEVSRPEPVRATEPEVVTRETLHPAPSVLTTLRTAVQSLAGRTRDKDNLVRTLRTMAAPAFLAAVAEALESYSSAVVGSYLSALAEEIEETDAG